MGKIVITMNIANYFLDEIQKVAAGWEIVCETDEEMLALHLPQAEIIVGWKHAIVKHCLVPDTRLRWVQSWGAGVDYIPLNEFAKWGIYLTTTSGIHALPISETIFAMMLSLVRKVHLSIRNQLNKQWNSVGTLGEINGKTIGIIGVGEIGSEIARIAKAFNMTVLGVRNSRQASQNVDRMYTINQLDDLLQESDFVVNALPLTLKTNHLMGMQQFRIMKPSAYYFNIGRGRTTNEADLFKALSDGIIAGAGLDVFEKEPLTPKSPLWELENVIITPHISGATEEYDRRAMKILITNLTDYVSGRELSVNRIDLEKQY